MDHRDEMRRLINLVENAVQAPLIEEEDEDEELDAILESMTEEELDEVSAKMMFKARNAAKAKGKDAQAKRFEKAITKKTWPERKAKLAANLKKRQAMAEETDRDDDDAVTSDKQRHDLLTKMGQLRHEIVDLTSKVVHPKSTPEDLKRGLARLSQSMQSALLPYNMRPGLWAKHPTRELRLINDPSLNGLIRNLPYYYEFIDKNNLELVKKALVAAENSLLQMTNSIYADLDLPKVQSFFRQ